MGLTMAIIFVISMPLLRLVFKKELKGGQSLEKEFDGQVLMHKDEGAIVSHSKVLLIKSIIVLIGVITLSSLQGITHLEVSIIAIGGSAVLLAITRIPLEKILHEVDWSTLLFFIGLFVIVGIAGHAGLLTILAKLALV